MRRLEQLITKLFDMAGGLSESKVLFNPATHHLPELGAVVGFSNDLADALDICSGISGSNGAFSTNQCRGLRLFGVIARFHRHDGPLDTHSHQGALRAADGEFGKVQIGDAKESRQVAPFARVPDAFGYAGGFEFSLLPG